MRAQDPSLKLTYAADWDSDLSPWQWGGTGLPAGTGNLGTQISFASELDSFGVDCYAPISDAADPTLAQLIAGWTQTPTDPTTKAVTGGKSLISYFESVAAEVGKPLIFTELGYANASDAASQPAYSSTNVVDPALQEKLYQAFFDAWQQAGNSSLTGVYFWNWDPNAAEVGPGTGVNFSPQEMPALAVVDDFFGPGDTVAISAPSINAKGALTLKGAVSGKSSAASVEIFNGTTALGAATLNTATGAWSFTDTLPSGNYTLTAQATDIYGRVTTSTITLTATTGIPHQAYTASARVAAANGQSATVYYSNGTTEVDTYVSGALAIADTTTSAGVQALVGHVNGLTLAAPSGNATLAGGGTGETFSFLNPFGHDTVTDFASHLAGASPDKLSLPSAPFHDSFARLLADTSFGETGATITLSSSESIFLTGLTKAAMTAHSADFGFH